MTVLTTERLTLNPMTPGDFAPLCRLWSNDAYVRQIGLPAMTPETVWLRLLRDIGHWQVMKTGNWAVRRREDGAWLGTAGIFDYRRDLEPPLGDLEAGWGFDPAFHGQGYGLEAVTEVLHHADEILKLKRTACMIAPQNEPSLRLAQKAGFRRWCDGDHRGERLILMERLARAA